MSELSDRAFALFCEGASVDEIVEQLELKKGTIISWKSRHNWDGRKEAMLASLRDHDPEPAPAQEQEKPIKYEKPVMEKADLWLTCSSCGKSGYIAEFLQIAIRKEEERIRAEAQDRILAEEIAKGKAGKGKAVTK